MNWNMQDASDVRFLAVSGTLWLEIAEQRMTSRW